MAVMTESIKNNPESRRSLRVPDSGSSQEDICQKVDQFLSREIGFIYDASFERLEFEEVDRAASAIDVFVMQPTGRQTQHEGQSAYISSLYENRLLTAKGEAALFRKLNFLKYWANIYRSSLDPKRPSAELIEEIEVLLSEADQVRSQLVQSNLRLVVSIARRFANDRVGFDDLVSEGNLILLKAVEKFDYSRGFRFSTYLTHSVQRHFYRHFRNAQRRKSTVVLTSEEVLREAVEATADSANDEALDMLKIKQLMSRMDECLEEREQYIVRERFGLNFSGKVRTLQSLAEELGICKERVRQLHHKAIEKLRGLAVLLRIDFIEA